MQPVVQRVLVPASEKELLITPLCMLCVIGDNFNWSKFWLGPYCKPPESLRNWFSRVVALLTDGNAIPSATAVCALYLTTVHL